MRAIRNPLVCASVWLLSFASLPVGLVLAGDPANNPALRLTTQTQGLLSQADPALAPNANAPNGAPVPPSIMNESPVDSGVFPENQGRLNFDCPDVCSWCNPGDLWTLKGAIAKRRGCEVDEMPVTIAGWTQFGFTNRTDGVFNTHPNNFDLHQGYLYLEKLADGSQGSSWGYRADILYGVDAANTQAFGNTPGRWDYLNGWDHGVYGFAMPQLYLEYAYCDTNIKVGHFYTPLGYEVVTAPGNFFYSHAFTMNFGEPFTHTGVLASHKYNDKLKLYGGWTLGWDTGFDRFNNGSNFIGGFTYTFSDTLSATYLTTYGNLGWVGNGYAHSIVIDKKLSDKWNYVLLSDNVSTDKGVFGGNTYHTISTSNYVFYTINECLKAGVRAEWWKADSVSYYELTGGVNFRPKANVVFRPEIRKQWSPAGPNPIGIPNPQTIFGIDMIITF